MASGEKTGLYLLILIYVLPESMSFDSGEMNSRLDSDFVCNISFDHP